MRRASRPLPFAIAAAVLAAALGVGGCSAGNDQVDKVIQRTKAARQTYALYVWNRINRPDGSVVEEWAAEFNRGPYHRIETPRDRVIADCDDQSGIWISLLTGERKSGEPVAKTACGINTNKSFGREESLGRVKTAFGDADRIRVTDADLIRTYDIADDGVILRTIFQKKGAGEPTVLTAETAGLTRDLPAEDMFTEQSLGRSYVSDRFRLPPPASPAKD